MWEFHFSFFAFIIFPFSIFYIYLGCFLSSHFFHFVVTCPNSLPSSPSNFSAFIILFSLFSLVNWKRLAQFQSTRNIRDGNGSIRSKKNNIKRSVQEQDKDDAWDASIWCRRRRQPPLPTNLLYALLIEMLLSNTAISSLYYLQSIII